MKRGLVLALALVLGAVPAVFAQLASGNIYGVVNDEQGGALPGAAVTLSGATIGTRSTTADSAGNFRFLNLDPGGYKLSVGLPGFATVNREVIVNTGASVNLAFGMKVATMEETITVDAETPVVDTKKTGTSTNFTQDELAKIPNSRDPWALLRSVPGVIMDRVNIAGNESGQQSAFAAKGSARADAVWNLDGVNITDMAAIGASPTYFDYDAFEEIQITTSGNDIRQSTGGVGLNFVTKRGTNSFHGTLRGYFTHESLGSANTPEELVNPSPAFRAAGAVPLTDDTANHNQQVADYGFDIGGPIVKDKLWFWGSYGKQDIRLVRSQGAAIDKTLLKDYNAKLNWQASGSDMVSVLWFLGAKEKFGRLTGNCAGCNEAPTATWNQGGSYPDNPFHGLFKIEDNHVFSPSLFVNAKYAYYGAGFSLTPQGGLDGQAGLSSRLSQTFGTAQLSNNVRPQHTANVDGSLFTNSMGGTNEWKFGVGWRKTEALTQTLWPGDQVVSYDTSLTNQRARVNREGLGINQTYYWSAYLGDTFSKNRLTLNVGVRWDRQGGKAVASDVRGNGAFPNVVPGITFNGYDAPFTWNDFSPRAGFTYALDEGRKTLIRLNAARYVTQLDTGTVGYMNPSGNQGWAEYPWVDRNGDHFAQPNEVTITPTPLATGGGFNPNNPTAVSSANLIDPDLQAPRTGEVVAGLDRELMPNFAVSVSYTFRHYDRFQFYPRNGMSAADYVPGTPVTGTFPDGTAYSIPTFNPIPARVTAGNNGRFATNSDDYTQRFHGVEFSANKRLSDKWMFRLAVGYNDHKEYYGAAVPVVVDEERGGVASGNPTRLDVDTLNSGGQVASRSAGSGSGDIFINGKWAINANGLYQLPWGMEVAASLFGKQGTPYPYFRTVALGQDGNQRVLLTQNVDSDRLDDLWNLDLRLAKNLKAGGANMTFTADLFNVFNSNTELNRQRNLGSARFGELTDYLSPRILRFGMRLGF
jgi:Carboxypeptidase regulatory-like domain/TonB-dependent Receptor Plug Domain